MNRPKEIDDKIDELTMYLDEHPKLMYLKMNAKIDFNVIVKYIEKLEKGY